MHRWVSRSSFSCRNAARAGPDRRNVLLSGKCCPALLSHHPHPVCQLREVLPCLLHNEAQLEDGTVRVGDTVKSAVFEVVALAARNVAPEKRQKAERPVPPGSSPPQRSRQSQALLALTWRTGIWGSGCCS